MPSRTRLSSPRSDHARLASGFWYVSGTGYGLPASGYGEGTTQAGPRSPEPAGRETGFLLLEVQPPVAEVYVDGYYVGTVADAGESTFGLALEARPHRVEIRAAGFESVTFDVRIVSDETVTYRKVLPRVEDQPAPVIRAAAAVTPKTLYVVPRCYAGDKPPTAAQLPAGCDPASVRIIPPTPVVARTR